jgi:hypothetical protein
MKELHNHINVVGQLETDQQKRERRDRRDKTIILVATLIILGLAMVINLTLPASYTRDYSYPGALEPVKSTESMNLFVNIWNLIKPSE